MNRLYDALLGAHADSDAILLETPGGAPISYRAMHAWAGRVASALLQLGLQPGDRVAAQVEKSPAVIALYLGVVRAGGVYLPLNTGYTGAEIEYFLGDAEPRLFIHDPARSAELEDLGQRLGVATRTLGADGLGSWSGLLEAADADAPALARSGDDLAAILYTSGTTGRSKGAMLSHDNLLSNALTLRDYWHCSAEDTLLHALPIFHTHGLFVATNTLMVAGGSMIFLPRFDADAILAALPRASMMMGVPTFYTRLLDRPELTRELTANMRLFISGSAPLLAETHVEFSARTGQAILERYGMTETNMNTSNPYAGERRAGTVGFPLPGVELRIVDAESGQPLPAGEVGIIEVRGPNVFAGYWRMPEKTATEFRDDGFFITGDLASLDPDGYVRIVGRAKDLIISGGFNVYPKEIEEVIDEIDGVLESAVIGVPHRDFGEAVIAVVVPRPQTELDAGSIGADLSGRLARYKQPKRIHFVDELPRNTMGKVQKNLLRERYVDSFKA